MIKNKQDVFAFADEIGKKLKKEKIVYRRYSEPRKYGYRIKFYALRREGSFLDKKDPILIDHLVKMGIIKQIMEENGAWELTRKTKSGHFQPLSLIIYLSF